MFFKYFKEFSLVIVLLTPVALLNYKNEFGYTGVILEFTGSKLLNNESSKHFINKRGENLLVYAARVESQTEFAKLLNLGIKLKSESCRESSSCYTKNVISSVLSRKDGRARDNILNKIIEDKLSFHDTAGIDEDNMLILAAKYCEPKLAAALIQDGLEINQRNRLGQTALQHAVKVGCWPIITKLLNSGARTDIVDLNGRTLSSYFMPKHKDNIALYVKQWQARFPASKSR